MLIYCQLLISLLHRSTISHVLVHCWDNDKGSSSAELELFFELSPAEKGKGEDLCCFWKIIVRGVKKERKRKRKIIRGRKTKGREGMLPLWP